MGDRGIDTVRDIARVSDVNERDNRARSERQQEYSFQIHPRRPVSNVLHIRLHGQPTLLLAPVTRSSRSAEKCTISGADGRTRTDDLLITNQLLYQLSYVSAEDAARHARNEAK